MDTMTSVQELAGEAYACFETAKRPSGEEFTRVKDGSPEWVTELVRKAHGDDFLPDDWRYETIRSALAFLGDEATEPEEEHGEFADTQVDVYTSELLAWLSSHSARVGYVDEAVSEFGYPEGGIIAAIGAGQYLEARDVYGLTLAALQDRAD